VEHPELRQTVFGQVLAELLEARDLEVSPFAVGKLAEEAGLDGWKVINRMADTGVVDAGYLEGLAGELAALKADARHWLTSPEYAVLHLRLENAHAAVEAALIEARRRVRMNEERPGG
jgi:hypothetical protein